MDLWVGCIEGTLLFLIIWSQRLFSCTACFSLVCLGKLETGVFDLLFSCFVLCWRRFFFNQCYSATDGELARRPESLLWYDRFQVTISVVDDCSCGKEGWHALWQTYLNLLFIRVWRGASTFSVVAIIDSRTFVYVRIHDHLREVDDQHHNVCSWQVCQRSL